MNERQEDHVRAALRFTNETFYYGSETLSKLLPWISIALTGIAHTVLEQALLWSFHKHSAH